MKKTSLLLAFPLLAGLTINKAAAQSYTSSNYASTGDTMYLTRATLVSTNFDTTGAGITWDYSSLVGNSQKRLLFRTSAQSGFSQVQWPYIFLPNNVNLSSSDEQSILIASLEVSNPNDYFKKTTSLLQQSASSFDINTNSTSLSIKNTYSTPDVIYKFPLAFGNIDSSSGRSTTSIPNVFYHDKKINRKNSIDGYGTVKTPNGTFTNCLRLISSVMQIDTISIDTLSVLDTVYYRELQWLDPSKKYPVLIVHQNKVGSQYITSTITFLDNQQYFQPNPAFAYYMPNPVIGDTVFFQNLSTNSLNFLWNFGDPTSALNNASTAINPQHIFNASGTYQVKLYCYNGNLVDSITHPVIVQTATGIASKSVPCNIQIYPNPTKGKLYVNIIDNENNPVQLKIFNELGQVVFHQNISNTLGRKEVDISHLESGLYFIYLTTDAKLIFNQKIIITKE